MKDTGSAGTRTRPGRVLIVDDHPLLRSGLRALIGSRPEMEVCGEAASPGEAFQRVSERMPDAVIADLTMKDGDGLDLIRDLKARFPDLPVLVLSMHDEQLFAERVLRAGARGYVMKSEPPEKILDGLRTVLDGGLFVSPQVSSLLLNTFVSGPLRAPDRVGVQRLSDREIQIFESIGRGLSTREIAERFKLSPKTVETYRANIKRKLGLESGNALIHSAIHWVHHEASSPQPGAVPDSRLPPVRAPRAKPATARRKK